MDAASSMLASIPADVAMNDSERLMVPIPKVISEYERMNVLSYREARVSAVSAAVNSVCTR